MGFRNPNTSRRRISLKIEVLANKRTSIITSLAGSLSVLSISQVAYVWHICVSYMMPILRTGEGLCGCTRTGNLSCLVHVVLLLNWELQKIGADVVEEKIIFT